MNAEPLDFQRGEVGRETYDFAMRCFIVLAALMIVTGCATSSMGEAGDSADVVSFATNGVTTIRDPHSHARPDEVAVEHVTLDLEVNFQKKQLIGSVALRIRRAQPEASTLILDTDGLDIARVTLLPSRKPATYRMGEVDPTLGQKLEISLLPDTTEVVIGYASNPEAKALQWLEPAMTAGKQHPFLLSQSQAILARSWIPLQDTPQVRFTYDATIRVPKTLMALMSAENPQQKSADGVYRFRMEQAIPSYLLAIAVGDMAFRSFDDRSGVYAEPAVLEAAEREFNELPAMMAAAEELYGPYRWGRYDVLVLPPSFPYGGMENPRLTFLTPTIIAGDKSLVDLVAHELAHSWSGNLVTNATWNDFWLNEGFTTYFQHRITERMHGREYSEMLWSLEVNETRTALAELPAGDQSLYLKLRGRDPDEAPPTVYGKGALLLRLIEETIGREPWDRFLRSYFDTHAFRSITTNAFLAELNEQLPGVAEQVNLDAWIFGPGLPANCPAPQSTAFDEVARARETWLETGDVTLLDADGWSSHECVAFITGLPELPRGRMRNLDAHFRFSESGNSEVLAAWLEKAVQARYRDAYPALERFLRSQGRRKFLKPLYSALATNPQDLAFARRIYTEARPTYHPVSQGTIDGILKGKSD